MNFEKYWERLQDFNVTKEDKLMARGGWISCKKEVLNILEKNPRCDDYYYDLKDKIEKL